jgi:DNA mismatch repair protein MutL
VAKVSGYVSAPRERRTTRDGQYFFVNNRFVRDRTIAGGLLEGYRSVLPHGVYPVAFLFLDIPPEEIDVNVHPAKTEIRFRRTDAVKDVIAEAVRNALAAAGIVAEKDSRDETAYVPPPVTTNETSVPPYSPPPMQTQTQTPDRPLENASLFASGEAAAPAEQSENSSNATAAESTEPDFLFTDEPETADAYSHDFEAAAEARNTAFEEPPFAQTNAAAAPELPPVNSAANIPRSIEPTDLTSHKIRPIAQLHDSFIIAVDDEGMLLIDQHVAHERILFDKFRGKEAARAIESQNLLLPETFDLTPAQAEAFGLVESELESLGFGMMRLSGRTVAIRSIPTDLPAAEARNLFAELLDTIELDKRGGAKSTFRDDIAASLACKAAIKINMKLTPEKMNWLIERLLLTSSPTTCPHGRPVILRLTMKDIERGFQRS